MEKTKTSLFGVALTYRPTPNNTPTKLVRTNFTLTDDTSGLDTPYIIAKERTILALL